MAAVLKNPDSPGKPAAYGYQKNRISMRTNRYRLIVHKNENDWIIALFDHRHDSYENRNIARERPEIVKQLLPLLKEGNTGIIPDIETLIHALS